MQYTLKVLYLDEHLYLAAISKENLVANWNIYYWNPYLNLIFCNFRFIIGSFSLVTYKFTCALCLLSYFMSFLVFLLVLVSVPTQKTIENIYSSWIRLKCFSQTNLVKTQASGYFSRYLITGSTLWREVPGSEYKMSKIFVFIVLQMERDDEILLGTNIN